MLIAPAIAGSHSGGGAGVQDDLRTFAAMLATAEIVCAVADAATRLSLGPLVVDPVMVAKSGDRLLAPEAERACVERLFPLATIVTPNLPEAELLLGRSEAR